MTTPQLRYDQISDQTRARWVKLLGSARRDLTPRMRQLIRIALDACDSIGPPKMQARLWEDGTVLWFLCPQAELAQLVDCNDRTLRNDFKRLESCGCLQKFHHERIENLIAYEIPLNALEALPESLTPELDEIICAVMEARAVQAEISRVADPVTVSGVHSGGVSASISGSVSGPFSGGSSGPVAGQFSALIDDNDYDQLNTSDDDHQNHGQVTTAVWDMTSQEPLSFQAIRDEHSRAIAGCDVDGGVMSLRQRWVLFLRYWADVKVTEKRPLSQSDAVELLALFIYWGRAKTNKSRGGAIRTWWASRFGKPIVNTVKEALLREAERIMAAGLGTVQRPPAIAAVPPRVPESQRLKRLDLSDARERFARAKLETRQP